MRLLSNFVIFFRRASTKVGVQPTSDKTIIHMPCPLTSRQVLINRRLQLQFGLRGTKKWYSKFSFVAMQAGEGVQTRKEINLDECISTRRAKKAQNSVDPENPSPGVLYLCENFAEWAGARRRWGLVTKASVRKAARCVPKLGNDQTRFFFLSFSLFFFLPCSSKTVCAAMKTGIAELTDSWFWKGLRWKLKMKHINSHLGSKKPRGDSRWLFQLTGRLAISPLPLLIQSGLINASRSA